MQINLRGCYLYHFDPKKAFEAKYITKNLSANQKPGKHDENNVKYKNNTISKSWQKARLSVSLHV